MIHGRSTSKWALTVAAACMLLSGWANAVGRLVDVQVVDRMDGRHLPIVYKDGQAWIVGTPGHEYLLRIHNRAGGGRVLAVTSVDGVNVVSGETASPAQSGYVLTGLDSMEITGWRKSLASTAAFYFTDLGDAYASRTGRPDNVGVIGVAVFRERPSRAIDELSRLDTPMQKSRGATANSAAAAAAREESAMPATPAPSLGTGHGRNEASAAERVRFERASTSPNEVITIRYDRRENLVAMGILAPAPIASAPRAFPEWGAGFVADPPAR